MPSEGGPVVFADAVDVEAGLAQARTQNDEFSSRSEGTETPTARKPVFRMTWSWRTSSSTSSLSYELDHVRHTHRVIACLVVIGTAALLLAPWLHYGVNGLSVFVTTCEEAEQRATMVARSWRPLIGFTTNSMCNILSCSAGLFLLSRHWSKHLRMAALYSLLLWMESGCFMLSELLQCDGQAEGLAMAVGFAGHCIWLCALFLMQRLVLARINALEMAAWRSFRVETLRNLHHAQLIVGLLALMDFLGFEILTLSGSWSKVLLGSWCTTTVFLFITFVFCNTSFAVLTSMAFLTPIHMMNRAEQKAVDVRRASKITRMSLIGVVLSLCTSTIVVLGDASILCFQATHNIVTTRDQWALNNMLGWNFPECMDQFANLTCAILLSGALHVTKAGVLEAAAVEDQRLDRRLRMRTKCRKQIYADARWSEKVRELADRGLTLEKLLDFYDQLRRGKAMPHFDPALHSTHDVVREVIIPRTASSGRAYAELMMGGKPTRPDKMVTHNWSNKFRDLVAAVVADALDENDFSKAAHLLDHHFNGLVSILRRGHMMERRYWICAFSVAQHHAICGYSSRERDPITLEPHPVCLCGRQQFSNETPPLRADGKSIPCEMNKFSDMMALLAVEDANFEQVVAVDSKFELFNRAWCVAELAEAHKVGMNIRLKMRSAGNLSKYESSLRGLRIQDMKASRPQDIVDILASIPDKDAFNRRLQDLIFDPLTGMLAEWKGLDIMQQLELVGHIVRFMDATDGKQEREVDTIAQTPRDKSISV